MPRYITIPIGFAATGTLFRLAELVANELADDHDLNIEPNAVALALEEWSEQVASFEDHYYGRSRHAIPCQLRFSERFLLTPKHL